MVPSRSRLVLANKRIWRYCSDKEVHASRRLLTTQGSQGDGEAEKDEESTAWIPPNRPLAGAIPSPYYSEPFEQQTDITQLDSQNSGVDPTEKQEPEEGGDLVGIDWLQTRRSKLGSDSEVVGLDLVTPSEASRRRSELYDLPVKLHTLLSLEEITACVSSLGGQNILAINNEENRLGDCKRMVLVTCSSPAHICTISDAIVRNLKQRRLHEKGVVAAQFGSEASTKEDTWRVVDCRNHVLHLMDEATREHLALEKLWLSDIDNLRQVNPQNEDEVDDYVAANPVPDDFYSVAFRQQEQWTDTVARLQRSNSHWKPPRANKKRKEKNRNKQRGMWRA